MKYSSKIVVTIVCFLALSVSSNSQAQETSTYSIKSGKDALTLVPQPESGFVIQSSESFTEAFGGMLSSEGTEITKKVKGMKKRNISILLNEPSETINTEAFEVLQSNARITYSAPLYSINGQTVAVIPEIVVRLAFEEAYESLQSLCDSLGLTITKQLELTQKEYLLEVNGPDAESVFFAIEQLNKASFIEWAALNIASQPILASQVIPDDEYFSKLWHLHNTGQTGGTNNADVNAPEAWDITTGDPNIIIAIIDTGVDVNHPDLINNIVPGYDFFDDDNDPSPFLEDPLGAHGTNCAGLAAAQGNNGIGVAGVAWNCKIMPIRIVDSEDFITDSDIATAIRWAAENGADVLSNSWGSYYSSQIIYSGILDVTEQGGIGRDGKGCVVCFAAGNWEEEGPVAYPAARPEVIAVGATDHDDEVWYYSAIGPELDIVAPSGPMTNYEHYIWVKAYLWTTDITGIYGYSLENLDHNILDYSDTMTGTSGACPIVAGVAALVLSVDPNLTNIEVRRILLDTAIDLGELGTDEYYGFGRVDANAALELTLNPPPTPPVSNIILYVDDNAPDDPCAGDPEFSDPNENGTYKHPFDSIQKAVDYALYSETIIVLPGTYTGNGNNEIDFSGKAIRLRSESGPETCFIDCQESGRGFNLHNEEPSDTEIEGFTIINGKAYEGAGIYCSNGSSPTITDCVVRDCWSYSWGSQGGIGGGIYIGSSSNPTLKNCIFTKNMSSWDGGGVYVYYGNPTLENCTFEENTVGDYGGGLCNIYGQPTLTDCIFNNNSAQTNGGGMYNQDGYPTLTNCTFNGNEAIDYDGGGFYNDYGSPTFENCSFIGNKAGDWGGGICDSDGYSTMLTKCEFIENSAEGSGGGMYSYWSYPTLSNCLFSKNTTDDSGGAITFNSSFASLINCTFASNSASEGEGNAIACNSRWYWSDVIISNCIIWNGQDSIWNNDYSDIYATFSDIQLSGSNAWSGIGNINTDPEFADPNGDYHLKSQTGRWEPVSQTWLQDDITSPCINSGDPSSDYSNEPQPNGERINMGYYGGTSEASLSAFSEPVEPITQAYNPYPSNGAIIDDLNPTLSWTAGDDAVGHDVYFGTDANAVTDAERNNPLDVLQSQAQTSTEFSPAGTLLNYQDYYWRIDEVLSDDSIIRGEIWGFVTLLGGGGGNKGRACFTSQTPVWIDANTIPISNVCQGQCTGYTKSENVIEKLQEHHGKFDLFDILLENDNIITVANNHFFLTKSGQWISLKDLKAGTKLKTAKGSIEIKSISKQPKPYVGKVYNLKIKNSDQYLVGEDAVVVRDY